VSALYETIKAELATAADEILSQLGDGFQFADAWPMVSAATMSFTRIAQATGGTGPEKKEAVLLALEAFYAEKISSLDLPGVPNLFVEPVVDKALGALIRPCFGPLVDLVVAQFHDAKVF
jgi:hypothetical protein